MKQSHYEARLNAVANLARLNVVADVKQWHYVTRLNAVADMTPRRLQTGNTQRVCRCDWWNNRRYRFLLAGLQLPFRSICTSSACLLIKLEIQEKKRRRKKGEGGGGDLKR